MAWGVELDNFNMRRGSLHRGRHISSDLLRTILLLPSSLESSDDVLLKRESVRGLRKGSKRGERGRTDAYLATTLFSWTMLNSSVASTPLYNRIALHAGI